MKTRAVRRYRRARPARARHCAQRGRRGPRPKPVAVERHGREARARPAAGLARAPTGPFPDENRRSSPWSSSAWPSSYVRAHRRRQRWLCGGGGTDRARLRCSAAGLLGPRGPVRRWRHDRARGQAASVVPGSWAHGASCSGCSCWWRRGAPFRWARARIRSSGQTSRPGRERLERRSTRLFHGWSARSGWRSSAGWPPRGGQPGDGHDGAQDEPRDETGGPGGQGAAERSTLVTRRREQDPLRGDHDRRRAATGRRLPGRIRPSLGAGGPGGRRLARTRGAHANAGQSGPFDEAFHDWSDDGPVSRSPPRS